MRKLQLLFIAGLMVGLGSALTASAQSATPAKNQNSSQEQAAKNDNGHRKHWWSLPHLHHKKNQPQTAATNTTAGQSATVKPVKQAKSNSHPGTITVSEKPAAKTVATKSAKRTVPPTRASAKPVHRTVATTSHAQSRTTKKTVAATSHTKKTVRHNCSAEESKTGTCQAQHSTKPATTRS